MPSIYRIFIFFLFFKILFINSISPVNAEETFDTWLSSFKKVALEKNISQETINVAFKNVKFLDQVIKYDRKQPEFFEDTITYVTKRANALRVNKAKKLLKNNTDLFIDIENKFLVLFSPSLMPCVSRDSRKNFPLLLEFNALYIFNLII